MPKLFTNSLINESSPYLLQHAHNPVNWYPWGTVALEKARAEHKVILVSIGYAACHWCHVMERESFENETVAKLMNDNFINIKIDREERPDLDHIYMDAVQAMTGSGGWPLNVFLTPAAKPFYGGTYFPPSRAYNRSSWTEVLNGVQQGWLTKQDEILEQAETLTRHIQRSNDFGLTKTDIPATDGFTRLQCDTMFEHIMQSADTTWGGFGKPPKFPQTFTIQYLLQYHYFTGNTKALQQAVLSIDKMLEGGIYDHVGGGMSRYSTDNEWLAPHFEKMLYDNALLLNICCDAYQLTKEPRYEKAIRKTLHFVTSELMDTAGGFYAAIDADSEGEEGKYYVWEKKEIDELLGSDATLFCAYFDISASGNWQEAKGKNILRILHKAQSFAKEKGISFDAFEDRIAQNLGILMKERNKRVRPLLDDKILLGWNALMISALCKASAALADNNLLLLAKSSFNIILSNFQAAENSVGFYHSFKNGKANYPAFLDDYALLIQACIHLQEITSDSSYLLKAKELTAHVIDNFGDAETGYFFYTNKYQQDVIIRKKEVYDGAMPSGNSTMAENLFYLAVVFDNREWERIAGQITSKLIKTVVSYPSSFAIWASIILKQTYGVNEIVITGKNIDQVRMDLLQKFMPNMVLQCAVMEDNQFPLLTGKTYDEKAWIYKCKNYTCQTPVRTPEKLF